MAHNFQRKIEAMILQMVKEGKIAPFGFADINIFHDLSCAYLKGGECDCDPDIKIERTGLVDELCGPVGAMRPEEVN